MVSLLNVLLPSQDLAERKIFNNKLECTNDVAIQTIVSQKYRIASLFLKTAEETAQAIQKCQYKAFDALVKNFGCQMTALEVYQLVQDRNLIAESNRMLTEVGALKSTLKNLQASISPEIAKKNIEFFELMQKTFPDLANYKVSEKMARLIRFKLLNQVNDNKLVGNREVPVTNYDKVQRDLKDQKNFNFTKDLVDGLQVEEARQANSFIRQQLQLIPSTNPRKIILEQALQTTKEKGKTPQGRTPIPMISLLYNMEVCMRRVENGIFLVKNKLTLVGKPIQDATPCQVFVKMPEERILTPLEVESIEDETPLYVLEGYVKTKKLSEKIKEIGLFKLISINASDQAIQFLGCDSTLLAPNLEAERAELDSRKNEVFSVFEMDHAFCSSMKEERNEFRSTLSSDVLADLRSQFNDSKQDVFALCTTTKGES